MKASQSYIDRLINAALAFGTGIPTHVNTELIDNGYEPVEDVVLLTRAQEILERENE